MDIKHEMDDKIMRNPQVFTTKLKSQGTCKLKQQCDIATHLLEWPHFRMLITPRAGEAVEPKQSLLLMGKQNATGTLEDGLVVSNKTKHPLTI